MGTSTGLEKELAELWGWGYCLALVLAGWKLSFPWDRAGQSGNALGGMKQLISQWHYFQEHSMSSSICYLNHFHCVLEASPIHPSGDSVSNLPQRVFFLCPNYAGKKNKVLIVKELRVHNWIFNNQGKATAEQVWLQEEPINKSSLNQGLPLAAQDRRPAPAPHPRSPSSRTVWPGAGSCIGVPSSVIWLCLSYSWDKPAHETWRVCPCWPSAADCSTWA